MKDVAEITLEQGEHLTTVELQVNYTHKNVEETSKELNQVNFKIIFLYLVVL